MGWNDHVEFAETECLACGEVSRWEYWSDVALARYGGENAHLGEFLGHDYRKSGTCPHCGSSEGQICAEDEDEDDPFGWEEDSTIEANAGRVNEPLTQELRMVLDHLK